MARPKTQRTTDLRLVRQYFKSAQEKRFDALKMFINQIRNETLQQEVMHDDRLFSAILELASEEYGIRFSDLSERVHVSAAAVGRWAKQINLPPRALRPLVVEAIAELLENYVQRSVKERAELPRGRVYYAN
jgi:hypothetical protein